MFVTGEPWARRPDASMKNAPTVSPAQANPASGGMMPTTWSPELNRYWFVEAVGQNPPPPVGLLNTSEHVSPWFRSPHWNWLTVSTVVGEAKSENGLLRFRSRIRWYFSSTVWPATSEGS